MINLEEAVDIMSISSGLPIVVDTQEIILKDSHNSKDENTGEEEDEDDGNVKDTNQKGFRHPPPLELKLEPNKLIGGEIPKINHKNTIYITNVMDDDNVILDIKSDNTNNIESNTNNDIINTDNDNSNNNKNIINNQSFDIHNNESNIINGNSNNNSNNNNYNNNNNSNNSEIKKFVNNSRTGSFHLSPKSTSMSPILLSPNRNSCESNSDEEFVATDEIGKLFDSHFTSIERWLREKASSDILHKIHVITEDARSPRSPKRPSVTSDLFQQWLASSPIKKCRSPTSRNSISSRRHLQNLDEGELFMELIRDVANELDIDVLCHKILVNVGLLTHADRGSLFLAKGATNNRYLVAKLFDVTQDTALNDAVNKAKAEEIIIPFGVGIAGMVAQTKETINIKNVYEDSRFNCEIDLKTGYKTNVMLSMPICNYEGDVIGVAQIINKTNDSGEFTERDVEVFKRYLTFCGIGIQNAQLFEMSVQEYRRNQILLNLAKSIFEEQNNLECLVAKILTEAKDLLKCERCTVYLLDLDCCEASHLEKIVERPNQATHQSLSRRQSHNVNVEDILAQQNSKPRFTMKFKLGADNKFEVGRPTIDDLNTSTLSQVAQCVLANGQLINITDVTQWLKDNPDIIQDDEIHVTHTVLSMPILNGKKNVIGVKQLINKANGSPFTDSDVSILEAFVIFCGLSVHNTQMYENACKLMAKQKVALECLSYHATASQTQTLKLVQDIIQSAEDYCLYSFKFIDFDLSDDDTCRATIRMFLQCNLVQQFHVPYDVLCRWILSVRKNYRPVKYHNWRHAFNVTQTMFSMLKTGKMERFMTDLEIFGLLVATLCHDLDHRGTNNSFQSKIDSPLAILYTTSTMEHHHFDQCVMILNSEGNNIFQSLSPDDYRRVMRIVEEAILSTDLAKLHEKRSKFDKFTAQGEFDWQSEEKKDVLCGLMMTACDVSAISKPWEVQHRIAKLVADEFFDQGDLEKLQFNTKPMEMMDRDKKDELPMMQIRFIDSICVPLYRTLMESFPWVQPLYDGTIENRERWIDLAEKVAMGLTWIDHDYIDKPVEEFPTALSDELKNIEFTVQTLNRQSDSKSDSSAIVTGSASASTSVATTITSTVPTTTTSTATTSSGAGGSTSTIVEMTNVTPPERRRKFGSLRKTGALTKVIRSSLSKSFHTNNTNNNNNNNNNSNSNNNSNNSNNNINCSATTTTTTSSSSSSTKQGDKNLIGIPPSTTPVLEEKSNGTTLCTSSIPDNLSDTMDKNAVDDLANNSNPTNSRNTINPPINATKATSIKPEKHKKHSKLCSLL